MRTILLVVLCLLCINATAHNKVVVVPLGSDPTKPLQNVISVSPSNGDFRDPIAALNSIPTQGAGMPSAENRYLIVIGPGQYTLSETMQMRQYVSIVGAGSKNTHLIFEIETPSSGAAQAVITEADVSLSDLTIRFSEGVGGTGIVISNQGRRVLLQRLNIFSSGYDTGIALNSMGGELTLSETTINLSALDSVIGIDFTNFTEAEISDTQVTVFTSDGSARAFSISNSSPTIRNSTFRMNTEFGTSEGLQVSGNSRPIISNSRIGSITMKGNSIGVNLIGSAAAPIITSSTLIGDSAGLNLNSNASNAQILYSRILGGVSGDPIGSTQCRDNYDEILKSVSC